jgi:hypothetical protein
MRKPVGTVDRDAGPVVGLDAVGFDGHGTPTRFRAVLPGKAIRADRAVRQAVLREWKRVELDRYRGADRPLGWDGSLSRMLRDERPAACHDEKLPDTLGFLLGPLLALFRPQIHHFQTTPTADMPSEAGVRQ